MIKRLTFCGTVPLHVLYNRLRCVFSFTRRMNFHMFVGLVCWLCQMEVLQPKFYLIETKGKVLALSSGGAPAQVLPHRDKR